MYQAADTFALASRRVVRFGGVYSVVVALAGGLGLVGYTAVRSGAADPRDLSTQASFLIVGAVVGLVSLVCVIGLVISTVVWMISARRLPAAGPGLAGYGGVVLCFMLITLAYVLPSRVPTVSGAVATDVALRIGGVVLLIAAVLWVRARARRETGDTTLAGRPPLITSDDWDASTWDPEVLRDTDRRRRGATP